MPEKFAMTTPDALPLTEATAPGHAQGQPAHPQLAVVAADLDDQPTTPARGPRPPRSRPERQGRTSLVRERTGLLNYEFVEPIGEGGMAEVWLVRRQGYAGFRKRLALKRLLPQLRGSAELEARFVEEARIAASLDHPNVIQAVDFGDSDHGLFLAMEYVDGVSVRALQAHFQAAKLRFPLEIALHLARQAADALVYVHGATDATGRAMALVHCDVTPANLLVDRTGQLKLTDFGIALSGATADGEMPMVGSIGYMSPEQILGEPLTGQSDVYALSVVLCELLGGERLFPGGMSPGAALDARREAPARLPQLLAGRPSGLVALLRQALALDPADRPDANELRIRLELLRKPGSASEQAPQRLSELVMQLRAHGREPVANATALRSEQAPTALSPEHRLDGLAAVGARLFVARQRALRAVSQQRVTLIAALVGGISSALVFWALSLGSAAPAAAEPAFVLVPLGVELLTDGHGQPLAAPTRAGAR